jgi:hypothetical protein
VSDEIHLLKVKMTTYRFEIVPGLMNALAQPGVVAD